MKKRFISYLLTFAMILSMIPMQVFAEDLPQIVSVDKTEVKVGDKVRVQVFLPEGVEDVSGVTVKLKFNKESFEVVERTPADPVFISSRVSVYPVENMLLDDDTGEVIEDYSTQDGMMNIGISYQNDAMDLVGYKAIDAILKATAPGSMGLEFEVFVISKAGGVKVLEADDVATPPVVTAYTELTGVQAITGMAAPVKNGTPKTAADLSAPANTTVGLTWAPDAGTKFAANTAYTATINVKANTGYDFADGVTFTVDGEGWAEEKQADGSYNLTKTYPATAAKELTGIAVTTAPTKTEYVEGENFDPAGMVVTGTYDDNSTEPVNATVTNGTDLTFGQTSVTVQYGGKETTQAITVKKNLAAAEVTVSEHVYNGSEQKVTVTVKHNDSTVDVANYEVTGTASATNADTYELTLTGKGDFVGTKTVTWTIAKADMTADDYTVDLVKGNAGQALKASDLNIVTKGGTASVAYELTSGGEYVTLAGDVVTPKAVGTATIKATITEPNHNTLERTVTVNVIDKYVTDMTVTPQQDLTWTWGATEDELRSALTVKVEYNDGSVNEDYTDYFVEDWNSENPGTVTVTIKAGNVEKTVPVSFTKKNLTKDDFALQYTTAEYDGADQTGNPHYATVGVNIGTAGSLFHHHSAQNVGTYDVIVSTAGGTHYNAFPETKIGTLTIRAKAVTITGLTVANKEYDGDTDADVTSVAAIDGMVEGDVVAIKCGDATFDDKNVGNNKTVTFTGFELEGADKGNYTLSAQPESVTANITARAVTVSGIAATDRAYNGELTVALTGGELGGVVNGDTVTVVPGTGTMADAYVGADKQVTTNVTLGGADAGNYVLSGQPTDVTVDITTADQTPVITAAANVTKGGFTLNLKNLVRDAKGAVTFTISGEANGCTITDGVLTSGADEGTVKINVAVAASDLNSDNQNEYNAYTAAEAITVSVVNKTMLDVSGVAMDKASYTYGETVGYTGTPVAKLNGETIEDIEFDYEWVGTEAADAAPVNAGTYTLVVKVSDNNETYMGKLEIPFEIEKKSIAVPAADETVFTWNGNEQTYAVAANDAYEVTGNKQTAAGTYKVVVALKNTDNYKWSDDSITAKEYDFVINKLQVTKPEQQDAVVYNLAEQTYGVAATERYTVSNNVRKDVGTQKVTIALKDVANTEWTDGTTADLKHNFTINKLYINIPEQAPAVTYNGAEQTYGVASNDYYTVKGTTTAKNANESGYDVIIELKDKDNTAWVGNYTADVEQKFIIKKANLAIMANPQEVNVGDKALPELTYTVYGLKNGETLTFEPTMAYETTPDLTKAGTVRIKITGPEYLNDNYNEIDYIYAELEIVYVSNDDPNYEVEVEQPENGTVKLSSRHAEAGEKVTVTVTPDEGYELVELIVLDRKGNEIKVTETKNGKFVFKMPAGKVEILPVFEKTDADEEVENPFGDVADGAYYYDAVLWAVENGITNGMSETEFMPGAVCNRAQVVTFLWRAAGCPEPKSNLTPFVDVAPDAYYYDAVLWAVENGITNGMSATEFAPNGTVTRGQTVTFLWRAEKGSVAEGQSAFVDVAADAYYHSAVQWAVQNGVTNGMSATEFAPMNGCTRGQIVTFLYRAFAE